MIFTGKSTKHAPNLPALPGPGPVVSAATAAPRGSAWPLSASPAIASATSRSLTTAVTMLTLILLRWLRKMVIIKACGEREALMIIIRSRVTHLANHLLMITSGISIAWS